MDETGQAHRVIWSDAWALLLLRHWKAFRTPGSVRACLGLDAIVITTRNGSARSHLQASTIT
ncbi:hypothetical protein CEE69_14325 [Rhodopirellula bahusiensis]|uniref:Uncharacterized protein n=1 Tax=Rhodopirellula bahusiensis TaxID=2014065 RepID=A0A2G1W6D3_9BACT|nr:hypothetical protein CEE69_14325 [Rhodopirellula bahusiensis]